MAILHILLFADDQVHLSDSEDDLQRTLYASRNTVKQFGMKISPLKSKVMTFKGRVRVPTGNNFVLGLVYTFICLGCNISYKEGRNITSKISTFGSSEHCFRTKRGSKTVSIENM